MLNPDYDVVNKQFQDWFSDYNNNNERANECIRFGACGDQWLGSTEADRNFSNKEVLTFNTTQKFAKQFKAQIRQIEFSIGLWAKNDDNDVQQTNTYRLLLNHLILARQIIDKTAWALDKCADYGYSFLEINYDYDNDETRCLSPVVRCYEDQSIAFWDKNARSPFKTDGRFCGLRQKTSKQEFLSNYPEYENKCPWLNDSENDVIRYWYVEKESCNFIALKSGIYKREDLVMLDDERADKSDTKDPQSGLYKQPLVKTGYQKCVYFKLFCNERTVIDAKKFPSDRLPMPYHPSFTVWTADGAETYPLVYNFFGVQQLLNYVNSQLATMVKNSTGDKWILTPEHVVTDRARDYAKIINESEGSIVLDKDPDGILPQRERSADIPPVLVEYSQALSQVSNDISGAFFNPQNTDNVVVSGRAMDKITDSMNVMQIGAIALHIDFVNECAAIIKSMIPHLYTEERLLIARKQDGTSQPIFINKPNGTGGLKNNIQDLTNSYIYELTSTPVTAMVKENTLKYLQLMYSIKPELFDLTGDIFARNLDIPDAQELELRIKSQMDAKVIAYSQGEISLQDYQKSQAPMQQAKQQAMQMQMQEQQAKTTKISNEAQAVMLRAQGDSQKAQAMVQDANTKAQVAITNASVAQANTQINAQKVMGEQQQRGTQQALDETHMQYEREKAVYDQADKMVAHALNLHGINQQNMNCSGDDSDAVSPSQSS
jgi:hypothetical protein